ncbi:hypothetical protein ACN28G_02155 [Micromonospora sp. WMMA1923]|uniref:hypothetical protein n=1 Tax=Micromonospora sp. WMMA1923 TaxID=3404125 RepID=UPI003B92F150
MKIVGTAEGGARLWRLSSADGSWQEENDLILKVVFAMGGEVDLISVDRFVQEVEAFRGEYLSGDGPIFALYETVASIASAETRERRRLSPSERELIRAIRRKTFVLFEEQLQRDGKPGADPGLAQSPS